MSDCPPARNGTEPVRHLHRALSRTSKQDTEVRFDSLDAKVWRTERLWEAWRQVKANQGAPGVDGQAIETRVETGQAAERRKQLQQARRTKRSPCAPGRVVERPQPTGGPRPLGRATGADRVGQTAMQLVLEPLFAAACPDGSSGYRPQRDAKQAAMAMRADLDHRAWGVGEIALQAYCTSIPPGQLLQRITPRRADGSVLKLLQQPLQVGGKDRGQGVATTSGGPQGSPSAPWYSPLSLHLLDHLWHRRGDPETPGAPLHRSADAAIVGCRSSPQPVLAAFEAIATRREWPRNRAKTRVTRLTDGGAFVGGHCVTRKRPRSGKNTSSLFPAQSAQQQSRNRLQDLPARRAPGSPKACVARGHPRVTGWGNSCRHTHASQACRGLQRFVNSRFRRYVTQRRQGRGLGGQRVPNSTL